MVIADLTRLHLVIDKVANEAILKISKEGASDEKISGQRVWSSLKISSTNFPM